MVVLVGVLLATLTRLIQGDRPALDRRVVEAINGAVPGAEARILQTDTVGPRFADDLRRSAILSVFFGLLVVFIWSQTGLAMVILSAAVKAVPVEQMEAAELDGTNAWQRFRNVTLPGIRSSIVVVVTTVAIGALKIYDVVAVMTGGRNNSTVLAFDCTITVRLTGLIVAKGQTYRAEIDASTAITPAKRRTITLVGS